VIPIAQYRSNHQKNNQGLIRVDRIEEDPIYLQTEEHDEDDDDECGEDMFIQMSNDDNSYHNMRNPKTM
jgi:hypothetical protein